MSLTGNLPDALSFDAVSRATPLDLMKTGLAGMDTVSEIRASPIMGDFGGRGWEWIGNFFAVGGFWLMIRGIVRWHIPVGVGLGLLVPATLTYLVDSSTHPGPGFHLFAGASILCAFFIATVPVSAATSPKGRFIYGLGIGFLIFAIRKWGSYADGVAFADDYYFLVTIRTVVAEEVASAQAVHELRRLQQFQERTLAHLATGIMTVDAEGCVGLANPTALELLGTSAASEVDVDRQVRLGAESPPLRRWLAGLGEQGSGTVDAWLHPPGSDAAIPVSLTVSALPGELPGEVQYVCMIEDGRQRQALEAERRRAARQKELLIMAAEWAHDVRTPLTGILHSSELLAEALPPGPTGPTLVPSSKLTLLSVPPSPPLRLCRPMSLKSNVVPVTVMPSTAWSATRAARR